jgi:hypothetical protein
MRSELIFDVKSQVPNRFLLTKLLAKATRGFHKPGSRIQDTTNDVLVRFGRSNPISDVQLAQLPAPFFDRGKPGRLIAHSNGRSALPLEVKPSNALFEAIGVLRV